MTDTPSVRPRSDRPRVLLVDDNPGLLETLSDILAAAGFDVTPCQSCAEAREHIQTDGWDAVVLDIVLPEGNGIELLRLGLKTIPDTRFVLITAYTDSTLVDDARAAGAKHILHKPLDPERLLNILREITGWR
uniref:Response regulator n=1 Tax=candidate division WOR-3 bacterium TaxID=2052148 RepID=A0A7C4GGM3_UNCW3